MIKPVTFKSSEAIYKAFKARCSMNGVSVSKRLEELMSYDNEGDIFQTKKIEEAFDSLSSAIDKANALLLSAAPKAGKSEKEVKEFKEGDDF